MTAPVQEPSRSRSAVLEGFSAVPGVHCETTMLRNMLAHAGMAVSEQMLFGLGRGIDFQYFPAQGPGERTPMLTGRIEAGDIATKACAALSVTLLPTQATDDASARQHAWDALTAGRVVGVTVDIYHLDYFASRSHFSAHCVALYGLDGTAAHVVDTEQQGGAHRVSVESFTRARASAEGFMPTPNRQWHLADIPAVALEDLTGRQAQQVWPAIADAATRYLEDRGTDRGPRGIRRAADEIRTWHRLDNDESLIPDVGRFWRYAGTGGTNFRGLYLDFLTEAHTVTGDDQLRPLVARFRGIESRWRGLIDHLIGYPGATDRSAHLDDASEQLRGIADAEADAFGRLASLADQRARAL